MIFKVGGIKTTLVALCIAAGIALPALSQGMESFTVDPDNDRVWGNQWPTGSVVTVTLGSAPGQIIGTALADEWGHWGLWDVAYDIQSGMLVTVDDGTTSIEHTVKFLAVSEVDIDNDTVAGVAEADSSVQVVAVDMGTYQNMIRNVQADGAGNWVADFSEAVGENPEDAAFDITHGSSGWAGRSDSSSVPYGSTQDGWRVPKPYFHVEALSDSVWGGDWPTGGVVTVTMGEAPGQLVGTALVNEWGNWDLWNTASDIQPGSVVTVSNGNTVISHTVTSLAVTEVNTGSDVISGNAEPGSWVQAVINDEYVMHVYRNVQADGEGNWVADFSVAAGSDPGEEACDLQFGSEGWASQGDGSPVPYGSTYVRWNVPKPYFRVDPSNDSIWGHDWPPGGQVLIAVGEPVEFSTTASTDAWGNWNMWDVGFDFQSGDVVTVSNNTTVISYTVTSLTLSGVDAGLDVVHGTAAPGSWVQVEIDNAEDWIMRDVQADESGNWTADFSVAAGGRSWEAAFDIEAGTEGSATQDGNTSVPFGSTCIHWRIAKPYFRVDPSNDSIWGHDWPPGGQVHIAVGEPVEFSTTASIDSEGEWDLWDIGFDFQSNDVVTVSNNTTVISYTVTSLTLSGVDDGLDVVQGTAVPGSWVQVEINNAEEWIKRDVQADESGNWTADFSVAAGGRSWEAAFDIEAGTDGSATQEGNTSEPFGSTCIHWRVVNPFFHLNPRSHVIWGGDWPAEQTVTILVGDPGNPDYTAEVTSDRGGTWSIGDDEDTILLALGTRVQATCGTCVKTSVVEFVQVLEIDGEADTVSGTAAPGCWLQVNIDNADAGRKVQSDPEGRWEADFSTAAGGENWERAFDIAQGTQGVALIQDEDGDGTLAPWRWSNDPLEAFIAWFEIEGDGPSPYSEFSFELGGSGILSARIGTPLGAWHALAVDDWWGEQWRLQAVEPTFEPLDAAFPAGEYRLEIVGTSGTSTTAVTVAESLVRPNQMPVIVSPQTDVAWPEAYMQWNAPTNANFGATFVEVEDDYEDYDYGTQFTDVSVSQTLLSGLEPNKEYELKVIFANIQQVETNGISFEIARATFAIRQFTTALTSDPTLTNRVSWYAGKGVERGIGESWEFLEGHDRFGKGMTLMQEYVADTDPTNPASIFRIESVDLGPPVAVQMVPSSAARIYTLQRRASLQEGQWDAVPGQVDVSGGEGPLSDNAAPANSFFYRILVEIP